MKNQYLMHNRLGFRSILLRVFIALVVIAAIIHPFLVITPPTVKDEVKTTHTNVPNFARHASVQKKKKAFFSYLKAEITRQNDAILADRTFLLEIADSVLQQKPLENDAEKRLEEIVIYYKFDDKPLHIESNWQELLSMVDKIPFELALVQAANESAWGTSRFAREGYNFFGLWCYRKGCGFVPNRRDDDAEHEVARFRNLSHAVRTYLHNLNSYYAYEDLRMIRAQLRQQQQPVMAEALAQGLLSYSTRREEYVDELVSMIRFNRRFM
ncbi:glucosaminidase domain-containing protein [Alteromonadaceae bacterium BrNp21-10]|nr:glucosaminidase domain-containing protein [Alteromonadaceae bacterium BrNp21-10]